MVCNNDQSSVKAYLARGMAITATIVPSTYDIIMPKLRDRAVAAAQPCTGGTMGECVGECGTRALMEAVVLVHRYVFLRRTLPVQIAESQN